MTKHTVTSDDTTNWVGGIAVLVGFLAVAAVALWLVHTLLG